MTLDDTPTPKVDLFVHHYVAGARIDDACAKAGISRRTGFRLLQDQRVAEDIRELRAEVRRRTVDRLVAAMDVAIAQLVYHASATVEPTAASSVSAARTLLTTTSDWLETDEFRARLDALERRPPATLLHRPVVLELLERIGRNGHGDESAQDH